ncbi:MAG: tetratricopeptide repeat protein [Kineothrix sp.]|nr:tetratricopeptide repeat protein [Kineothrix sp.]
MKNAEMELKHRKKRKKKNNIKDKATHRKRELPLAERKRRRKRARKRVVFFERFLVACVIAAFLGGMGYFVWNIPSFRLTRQLDAGKEYTKKEAYDAAIKAYENALEIDSASVEAYRCMAGAYLGMEDDSHAKQILFDGWRSTQDEGLLQYYCTVLLNEAIAEINSDRISWETVEKIEDVLEQNMLEAEAMEAMETACRRLKEQMESANLDFASYQEMVNNLSDFYASTGLEGMKKIVSEFGWLSMEEIELPMEYVDVYLSILENANSLGEMPERSEMIACLYKVKEIQAQFADIFVQMDEGNYEAAKDFIVTDGYLQLRDAFINGTMEYWEGSTYIPVSREYVILKQKDGKCSFEFPNYDANENTAGVLTVWGNAMTDNGVQRSSLTYEPAKEGESYYPHTEYVISYMCSNVQRANGYVSDMNYHFETRVHTEAGTSTTMIGDWGGPYQWQKTY